MARFYAHRLTRLTFDGRSRLENPGLDDSLDQVELTLAKNITDLCPI